MEQPIANYYHELNWNHLQLQVERKTEKFNRMKSFCGIFSLLAKHLRSSGKNHNEIFILQQNRITKTQKAFLLDLHRLRRDKMEKFITHFSFFFCSRKNLLVLLFLSKN